MLVEENTNNDRRIEKIVNDAASPRRVSGKLGTNPAIRNAWQARNKHNRA